MSDQEALVAVDIGSLYMNSVVRLKIDVYRHL